MKDVYRVNDILEIDYKCRGYCTIPYYGHSSGCPNFGVHDECPPKAKLIRDVFNLEKDLFFIFEEFNLKDYVEKMRSKHPDWNYNQLKNLLYWQGSVRKRLKEKTIQFIKFHDNKMIYTLLPEAMGIMVINTTLKLGIPIEKNPKNKIFKIALVGYARNSCR